MTKTELLSKLKFVHPRECRTRGLFTLIQMFIHYFKDPSIPEYEHSGIFHSLPKHIVRAVDILRASDDPKILALRKLYLQEVEIEREIPSLTEIAFGGLGRAGLCYTLSRDLPKLLLPGEECVWLEKDLCSYFTAQDTVVKQMIHRFDLAVYQLGLYEIVNECKCSGMCGTFGSTTLRSFVMAGRVMFTLVRPHQNPNISFPEPSVSFVGEDGQKLEPRFGIQSMYADLATAITMFEDVMNNWPTDKKEQKKVYKASKTVGIG